MQAASARSQAEGVAGQLAQVRAEASALREQVAATSAACDAERQTRLAATSEVQVGFGSSCRKGLTLIALGCGVVSHLDGALPGRASVQLQRECT